MPRTTNELYRQSEEKFKEETIHCFAEDPQTLQDLIFIFGPQAALRLYQVAFNIKNSNLQYFITDTVNSPKISEQHSQIWQRMDELVHINNHKFPKFALWFKITFPSNPSLAALIRLDQRHLLNKVAEFLRYMGDVYPENKIAIDEKAEQLEQTRGHCAAFVICHHAFSHIGRSEWWQSALKELSISSIDEETLEEEIQLPQAKKSQTRFDLFSQICAWLIYYQDGLQLDDSYDSFNNRELDVQVLDRDGVVLSARCCAWAYLNWNANKLQQFLQHPLIATPKHHTITLEISNNSHVISLRIIPDDNHQSNKIFEVYDPNSFCGPLYFKNLREAFTEACTMLGTTALSIHCEIYEPVAQRKNIPPQNLTTDLLDQIRVSIPAVDARISNESESAPLIHAANRPNFDEAIFRYLFIHSNAAHQEQALRKLLLNVTHNCFVSKTEEMIAKLIMDLIEPEHLQHGPHDRICEVPKIQILLHGLIMRPSTHDIAIRHPTIFYFLPLLFKMENQGFGAIQEALQKRDPQRDISTHVNARIDSNGNRLLHFAVKRADWSVINLLLSAGANFGVKNNAGKTAYAGPTVDLAQPTALQQQGVFATRADAPIKPRPSPAASP